MRMRNLLPLSIIMLPVLMIASLFLPVLAYFTAIVQIAVLLVFVMIIIYNYNKMHHTNDPNIIDLDRIDICVAIPAYNEEEAIADVITDFKLIPFVSKVIVVDNNSSDNTSKRASEAGAIVVVEKKQGYGYASIRGLRECLEKSDSNIIALVEADSTFRASDLYIMTPYIRYADMVLGTRTYALLVEKKSQMDWLYYIGNIFLALLIDIKYIDKFVRLTDVGCTFRLIRRKALEKIIGKLRVGSSEFSPHMIMIALDNALSVIEVPITFWRRKGKSKEAGAGKWKGFLIGLKMLKLILID